MNIRLSGRMVSCLTMVGLKLWQQRRSNSFNVMAAKAYINSVKNVRLIAISYVWTRLAMVFFISGWVILHVAIFGFLELNPQAKLITAVVLGVFELLLAVGIIVFLLKESMWIKLSNINQVVRSVVKEGTNRRKEPDETKTSEKELS